MDYIKGECRTNLDDYDTDVNLFVAVPRIGEKVRVTKNGRLTALTVVGIVHKSVNGEPQIEVELNK